MHTVQRLHECLRYEGQFFGTQHVVEYQEEACLGEVRSHKALTRCAPITHRRSLATICPKALPLWRVFQSNDGGTHGETLVHTEGGRGQIPTG